MKLLKIFLLTVVLIALAVIGAVYFVSTVFFSGFQKTDTVETISCNDFDPKLWKESHQDVHNPRHHLLPSLKHCLHIGVSRAEVLKLMGEPDATEENSLTRDEVQWLRELLDEPSTVSNSSYIYRTDLYQLGLRPYSMDYSTYILYYVNDFLVDHRLTGG